MKKNISIFVVLCAIAGNVFAQKNHPPLKLWYKQPAVIWEDALPVGNGRLGAMIFGYTNTERIQINETSLWGGTARNTNNPASRQYLDTVRKLVLANKIDEAYNLSQKYLLAIPPTVRPYEHFMNLFIKYNDNGKVANYKRELNIINGIAKTTYTRGGSFFTEKVFSSTASDLLVVRIESKNKGGIHCRLQLERSQDAIVSASGTTITLKGQIRDTANVEMGPSGDNMKFCGILKAVNTGGNISTDGNELVVNGATAITIYINAATDYDAEHMNLNRSINVIASCKKGFTAIQHQTYTTVLAKHTAEHQSVMNRMSLDFGDEEKNNMPTDERLQAVKNGTQDRALDALFFQYGRYLLKSSAGGSTKLPPNLQGIWCYQFNPAWRSDYHTNINLQMNYWPAEECNLTETTRPLFHFLDKLKINGRISAKEIYGVDGWVVHHNTSPFGETSIRDGAFAGMYPIATGWMCLHEWEHYLFTGNKKFLADTAYPIMKEAAVFLKNILVKSPEGYMVIAPSYSPENSFIHPVTGNPTRMTYGVTMDVEILQEFFTACIKASEVLKTDDAFRQELSKVLTQMPPIKINSYGGVQEWIEDYKEFELGHRHISHLFGLYPGTTINQQTPALFEAAKKTLEHRLSNGGGHTGWSRAWIINFYARLLDGEQAYHHLQLLFQKSMLKNLFDNHPPFQIDGNFGGTAGIAEMLLQSHTGTIQLLPALPIAWKNGSIKGICARGGFVVDMQWHDGQLVECKMFSKNGGTCKVMYKQKAIAINTKPKSNYALTKLLLE